MTYLPCVIRADYRGRFRIRLTFNDHSGGTVDFRPWLEGPVFEPLRDVARFREFFVDGGTVAWPNGADIAPETLYEAALHRSAGASPKRMRRNHSQRAAEETLLKLKRVKVGVHS